jgi:small subunit ribosomal protein S15
MPIVKEKKKKVITDFRRSKNDTGSSEVQIALLTERINQLSKHFETNPKDHHSRYGLIKMVGLRKRLLSYLKTVAPERYKDIIARLELRK